MNHYVYLITNLKSGKQYVGDHSTDNLKDGYLGSGKLLLEDKRKFKKENFKKEILEFFDTKKEAYDTQEKYIIKYKTHVSEGGYNISRIGGSCDKGHYNHTEESKKKMSESHKGKVLSKETKERMRISAMGHERWNGKTHSDKTKKKMSESHKGKVLSEETKRKMSDVAKGKIVSEETKKKMSVARKGKTYKKSKKKNISEKISKNHGNKGREFSEEHKKRISKAKKGCVSPRKGVKLSKETKKKMSESHKKN